MRKNGMAMALAACVVMGIGMVAVGDDYTIDPVHSSVTFQISHLDLSFVHGRFNQFSGEISLDPADPSKSSFAKRRRKSLWSSSSPSTNRTCSTPPSLSASTTTCPSGRCTARTRSTRPSTRIVERNVPSSTTRHASPASRPETRSEYGPFGLSTARIIEHPSLGTPRDRLRRC